MTRGYQNNNPGNIRLTWLDAARKKPEYWQGEIPGKDKAFKTFKSMAWGYRALFVNLRYYFNNLGLNTIRKIINTYAPTNENDTEAYISRVSKTTGLLPDQKINFNDAPTMKKLVAAISLVENGIAADPNQISEGHNLMKTT